VARLTKMIEIISELITNFQRVNITTAPKRQAAGRVLQLGDGRFVLRIAGFPNFACAVSFVTYRDYADYILKVCWIIESECFVDRFSAD